MLKEFPSHLKNLFFFIEFIIEIPSKIPLMQLHDIRIDLLPVILQKYVLSGIIYRAGLINVDARRSNLFFEVKFAEQLLQ